MKFMLALSLERTALASVSAALWKTWWTKELPYVVEDPVEATSRMSVSNLWSRSDIDWKKVKDEVKESVQKLILPINLKEKLSESVDAAGSQIESWIKFHVQYFMIEHKFPERFVWAWTSIGTIDLEKTAISIVCDDAIDIACRIRLACIYCLEKHILTLFNQIDTRERVGNIINSGSSVGRLSHFISELCNYFWAKQKQQKSIHYPPGCSHIELFEKALENFGFCMAAKFFYLKSLERQNNEIIAPIINRAITEYTVYNFCCSHLLDTERLCFLLNPLNEDQQIQVLSSDPNFFLITMFLKWPWHELFIKVYQLVGHLLDVEDFHGLLVEVMDEKKISSLHCDYENIFIYLWQEASIECKKFINTNSPDYVSDWFNNLCQHENWYACSLILEDAPEGKRIFLEGASVKRRKLWFSYWFHTAIKYFASLILEGKWNKIEYFLTICHLSNIEIIIFRDEIIKRSEFSPDIEENVKMFNNIIDAFITANEKRCIENSKSKTEGFCDAES